MKRYKVIVEREFIVYAESHADAEQKVLAYFNSITPPASRPIRVTSVKRLKPVESERHEVIDVAPARETRK